MFNTEKDYENAIKNAQFYKSDEKVKSGKLLSLNLLFVAILAYAGFNYLKSHNHSSSLPISKQAVLGVSETIDDSQVDDEKLMEAEGKIADALMVRIYSREQDLYEKLTSVGVEVPNNLHASDGAQREALMNMIRAYAAEKVNFSDEDKGLKEGSIKIYLKGVAGQSFGAFLSKGVELYLNGVGNDYVAKGMNGGKIIINPPHQGDGFSGAGNTCLYGATGGKVYIRANVGERFAVRNSGCKAVVEGTGDNACEYMTGGVVVILGETGINFGAGMTGGVAFVYDKNKTFIDNMNGELIEALRIDTDDNEKERLYLKKMLKDYYNETKSNKAKEILDNFRLEIRNFWMVKPKKMTVLPLNPDEGD